MLRSATTEAYEDQRSEVAEVAKASEATKGPKDAEVARDVKDVKAYEASKASEVARVAEESRHLYKEAERESIGASTHQNPCKSSNAYSSTIFDFVDVNTSSILFPITYITNPSNTLESTSNEPEITNALETNGP